MALENEYQLEIDGEAVQPGFFATYEEFYLDPAMDCYGFRFNEKWKIESGVVLDASN